jgi:hypothetical protein
MKRFIQLIFLLLVALSIYSFIKKRELPAYTEFAKVTRYDPVQTPSSRPAFSVAFEDRTHPITPLHEYEIAGMIVSCGFSETLSEYYKDRLNILDVGLIWGDNLDPEIYRKVKFHTNGVRLFWKAKNRSDFDKIDETKISNNHLLCVDPELTKQVKALKRGDVISIKGFLANYSGRKSSVTRTDRGDGACEVLWVNELKVLQDGTRVWHLLFKASLCGIGLWMLAQVVYFFVRPARC